MASNSNVSRKKKGKAKKSVEEITNKFLTIQETFYLNNLYTYDYNLAMLLISEFAKNKIQCNLITTRQKDGYRYQIQYGKHELDRFSESINN